MYLQVFITLAFGIPVVLLLLRYLFKIRVFSLFLFLYVLFFWVYYVSTGEILIINEDWVLNGTVITHVQSTTQLPYMPMIPLVSIFMFCSFAILDFTKVIVE